MRVRCSIIPAGEIKTVELPDNATVAEALNAAQLDPSGYQITVDNRTVGLADRVSEGSMVFLVKNVKGA